MIHALLAAALVAPIPIHHDRDATALALAGPDVVVMSEPTGGGLRLDALPRTGGRARTLLRLRADVSDGNVAASAERVGAIVEVDGTKNRPDEYRVYSGPPSGPVTLVRRTPDP